MRRPENPDTLTEGAESLKLSDIDEASVSGKRLLGCAAEVLKNIGKAGADSIAVSDFDDKSKIFAKTPFNADGIITELSCEGDSGLIDVFKLAIKNLRGKNRPLRARRRRRPDDRGLLFPAGGISKMARYSAH